MKISRDTLERSSQDEVKRVTRQSQNKQMELQQRVHELESKYCKHSLFQRFKGVSEIHQDD